MTARISGPKRARIGGHFRAAVLAMAAVLVTAGAPIVLVSCGTADDPKEYREKVAQKIIEAATPSAENFAEWRGAWVKDSWILALKRDEPALRSKESLALHLVKGLSSRFGSQLLPDELATLGGFLSERIEVELLDIANLERPAAGAITRQDIFGFGFVRFKDGEDVFARLLDASHDALPTEEFERARSAVAAQFESLSAIRGIAWAEPNLEGEVQDTRPKLSAWTPPDEFTIDSDISRLLKSIKYDKAMEALDGRQAREIVVAVVDTGVDSGSPELEGRIFVNEKEKNGKPFVDDDGNGYVDDIHGYDATVEKGKIDSSISPVPGSADLGGPGKKCPVGDVESGGRPDSCGHGTHVAGIIAGGLPENLDGGKDFRVFETVFASDPSGENKDQKLEERKVSASRRLRGVAPSCRLISLKVLDDNGRGRSSNIMRALQYIREDLNGDPKMLRVHGVNLSIGYEFDAEMFACGQSPLCVEVDRLVKSGVVVVVAAGNTGYGRVNADQRQTKVGLSNTINDPGNAELAITVGATHRDAPHMYGVSYFSSKGPTGDGRLKPDLVAPGERITSCAAGKKLAKNGGEVPDDLPAYIDDSGTSMAAPHVSGAIAAFLSIRREFIQRPEEVKRIFLTSAISLGRERYFEGHGMLDLMRAIQSV